MPEENNRNIYNQNYYNVQRTFYNNWNNGYQVEEKPKHKKIILLIIIGIIFLLLLFLTFLLIFNKSSKKERTFMIYMVGSDLESKSSQGTFSLSDVLEDEIDLDNNNVVLMVGGSEKWHNDYINVNEIGLFELNSKEFKKLKSYPVESMGSSSVLQGFLEYSYNNYPADKYDLIFWNHGLGSLGIEQDELSKDFLTISELNTAFRNSPFNDEKLELTIFYNCLASNMHIANIMKNYSNYMVASEEILYLAQSLNRLKFLEDVKPDDTGYDIGYLFIKQSDKVVKEYNNIHTKKLDSTLSILDLNEIDKLNNKLNNFIKLVNLDKNYYDISNYRRKTHTYGISQTYDYDMIDLYDFVEYIGNVTNNNIMSQEVLDQISEVVKYTSNFNNYSNGISVYFPYFGKDSSIETHLSLFGKIFNDDYYSFINDFYQVRIGAKKIRRGNIGNNVNKLTNSINKTDNILSIELTEEEKNNYQGATIYLFNKEDNKYNLLLKSNNLNLVDNKLEFTNNKLLKVNDNYVSYDIDKVYGKLSNDSDLLDVKFYIDDNKINEVILDSNEYISSSIIELDNYQDIYFSKIKYSLFENEIFNEDFKDTKEKEDFKVDKNNLNITYQDNNESEYYVLIEVQDIYNDSYYSNLELIK